MDELHVHRLVCTLYKDPLLCNSWALCTVDNMAYVWDSLIVYPIRNEQDEVMQASVVLLCVVSWLLGPSGALQSPEKAAIRAYKKGQLKQAAQVLNLLHTRPRRKRERWSRWNAERTRVAYLAARIALRRKRPDEAIRWLKPLERKPSQIRDYIAYTLARAYQDAGRPKAAIRLYRYILKEYEHHWRRPVRRHLIHALRSAKQWNELGDHLKKLLWHPRPYGGRRRVLWQMVEAYLKAGKIQPMKKWLRHFPLRYPMSPEAQRARTYIHSLKTKKTKLKLRAWNVNEQIWRLHNLAWRHPQDTIQRVKKELRKITGKRKKDAIRKGQLRLVIARAHARTRRFKDIIPIAEPLTHSFYPDWMRRRATYLLGRAYIEVGVYKKGSRFLHRYAEREPERKMARWASRWAARLAMLGGEYKRARRLFWEYLKIYPDMRRKSRMQVKWFRAWCLFRLGRYKKTLYAFKKLRRIARSRGLKRRIAYWTGRAYERKGDWRKAQATYSKLVRTVALSYYGILAKQRLYVIEVRIRRFSHVGTCQRRTIFSKLKRPQRVVKHKKKRRRRRTRRRRRKRTAPKKEQMRVPITNPRWSQKFTSPWKEGWTMMMDLDTHEPITRARLDKTMRQNVLSTIQHATRPVPFPSLPKYCYRKNTRYCKRARRAEVLARLGFQKEAVDELFRGRWVMKRPRARLVATIRWFRSISAHHEAIRMSYWLGNWPRSFNEKEYMSLRYPPAHAPLLFRFTKNYKVSLAFAWGIMREESLFFQKTYSSAAARGLMQLIPKTAFRIAKILGYTSFSLRKLYRPQVNIQMGCWYLGQLLHKFEYNVALAAAAYNAGPHRVVSWLKKRHHLAADEFSEEIPFDETREYVRRVLRSYTVYTYLYKRSLPAHSSTVAVRIKDNINF